MLGGSAYAAVSLSNNSVKSKHITRGAVKRSDIANNAVTAAKVADGSLRPQDFKAGEFPAGPRGPAGPKGDKGDPGARGLPGADGTDGTARAYARVRPNASSSCNGGPFEDECTISHAQGVASVFRPQGDATGKYCVQAPGIDPASVAPAVTVDWQSTTTPEGNASAMIRMLENSAGECGTGVFEVITMRRGATNDAVLADNVGFTIVIP